MNPHTKTPPVGIPVRLKESVLWSCALLALVVGAFGTELLPMISGAPGFIYVTMKFVVLPAWSLIVLAVLAVGLFGDGHLPLQAWGASAIAATYLAVLFYFPLPWF